MRVTIIPLDSIVTIDGESFNDIDMSSIDESVHAVQWYGNHGEVEIKDPVTNKMIQNIPIDNLSDFDNVISQFQSKKLIRDAELAELSATQNIQEV